MKFFLLTVSVFSSSLVLIVEEVEGTSTSGGLGVVNVAYSDSITCVLEKNASLVFSDGEFESDISEESLKITINDINSDKPILVSNNGSSSLVKVGNHMFETTAFGYVNVFTFFSDKNVMIMSKQYSLFGIPVGYLLIGSCLGLS